MSALPPARTDLVASELVAVVVAVTSAGPHVLTVGDPKGIPRLPSGPLRAEHRSLQTSLRMWVQRQTGVELGYVEQLYTFADRERAGSHHHLLSVSYLGLTRVERQEDARGFAWRPWSEFVPWEDRRAEAARARAEDLHTRLRAWAGDTANVDVRADRLARVDAAFGAAWESELTLHPLPTALRGRPAGGPRGRHRVIVISMGCEQLLKTVGLGVLFDLPRPVKARLTRTAHTEARPAVRPRGVAPRTSHEALPEGVRLGEYTSPVPEAARERVDSLR